MFVSDGAISNVVHDSVIEKHAVLWYDSNVGAEVSQLHLTDVLAVDQNLARGEVIESVEETHDCGLSRSSLAYDTDRLT